MDGNMDDHSGDHSDDNSITRPDGRKVGYGQYGDPHGTPVVLLHGTPGSRFIGRIADRWAREAGARVIAPDRPGCGLSTPQEGRNFVDHAEDVAAICDELEIGNYSVIGISGGTPYVLACAATHPDRVTAGAIVSGFFGIDPPVDVNDFTQELAVYWKSIRDDPETARPNLAQVASLMQSVTDPQPFMLQLMATSPSWARELVEADASLAENYVAHLVEGLVQGPEGAIQELGMECRPWGIGLKHVQCPMGIWHGSLDPTPRTHVDAIANTLSDATVFWHEGAGHVDTALLFPDFLRWVKSQ